MLIYNKQSVSKHANPRSRAKGVYLFRSLNRTQIQLGMSTPRAGVPLAGRCLRS